MFYRKVNTQKSNPIFTFPSIGLCRLDVWIGDKGIPFIKLALSVHVDLFQVVGSVNNKGLLGDGWHWGLTFKISVIPGQSWKMYHLGEKMDFPCNFHCLSHLKSVCVGGGGTKLEKKKFKAKKKNRLINAYIYMYLCICTFVYMCIE